MDHNTNNHLASVEISPPSSPSPAKTRPAKRPLSSGDINNNNDSSIQNDQPKKSKNSKRNDHYTDLRECMEEEMACSPELFLLESLRKRFRPTPFAKTFQHPNDPFTPRFHKVHSLPRGYRTPKAFPSGYMSQRSNYFNISKIIE